MTNLVPSQYREVSVTSVDFALSAAPLRDFLVGREVYRRTRFVVLRRGPDAAIVEVERSPGKQVMAVVTAATVLALPDECAFVVAPEVDTGVPSSLAHAARTYAPGSRAVVVQGRYQHINFILDPSPVVVRVVDVVPPEPPKLVDQAERVLALAEGLSPVSLVAHVVDLADLARSHPASRYLLPCRGSGFVAEGATEGAPEVAFLDERPPRQDWTLIGCSRSRELHRWFYGDLPEMVDMCPRVLAAGHGGATPGVTLTKCCLLEDRIDCEGDTVVVPWGASLEQVGRGLRAVVELAAKKEVDFLEKAAAEATWSPA